MEQELRALSEYGRPLRLGLGVITQETLENRVEVKDPNDAVYGGENGTTVTLGQNNAKKLRTGVMEQWKEILNQGNGIKDRGPKQGTGTTDKATEINNEHIY